MTETRDERRERKVPEIIYRLDAKVYHGTLSVMDALEAADAAGERAGLERAAQWCDENGWQSAAVGIRALAAEGGGDE